ncbi:CHASE2 domain-containing protein [Methylobacterium mesophilicum]|nr:adenylate/guanylate cyclase domain-containing protein [Methylobacterium mesophilicum]
MARAVGFGRALGVLVLAVLVLVRIWDPFPVETARLRTFDALQTLKPRSVAEAPVTIVDIDEASLRALGQWPWPRTVIARLVDRLTAMGAAAIAFDIVFSEPDRTSPAAVATSLPDLDPLLRTRLAALPGNDERLAEAIARSRVILGQTALGTPTPEAATAVPSSIAVLGPDAAPFLTAFPGLQHNLSVLEQAAAGRGLFTIVPERDGIVRRVPVVLRVRDTIVPTLTLEVLRVLAGGNAILIRTDAVGLQSVRVPGFTLPTDAHGQVWLHFAAHDPARFVPAKDVLDGTVDPERVRDRIILVGTSAIGLLDSKTTPLDRAIPGVEIHAQLLESALSGGLLAVPNYALTVELLVMVLVSAAMIWLAPILGPVALLNVGAVIAAILAALSWYRFAYTGVLFDATYPLGGSFLVYAVLVFTNFAREQFARDRIRAAFSQYLSPALVDELARSPDRLRLGGEQRMMTVMFSDVRSFTTIAEFYRDDPAGLTELMNRFLSPLTDAIIETRGTIDKYMGDAIMAFWNAPLDDAEQERNACFAALEMERRMAELNERRALEAKSGRHPVLPIDIGIGINTGPCVVGNMGSNLRFDYSVLGDAVNLASRLEGQSKIYGTRILLGTRTALAVVDSLAILEIDLVRVKGKQEPERVFALIGDSDLRRTEPFRALVEAHTTLLAGYRAQDWNAAEQAMEAARTAGRAFALDTLYTLYADRIAEFRLRPPGPGWDAVYEALTK